MLGLSNKSFTLLVAAFYALYGISKLAFIAILYLVPYKYLQIIPLINLFIHKDYTLAGIMYEIVFGLFAVYTICYAIALYAFAHKHRSIFSFLMTPHLETILMVVMGVYLVVFYLLVIYSTLPISKNPDFTQMYWYMGVGSGLSFIVFPILFALATALIPHIRNLDIQTKALIVLVAVIIIAVIMGLIITHFYKPKSTPNEQISHQK